MNVQPVLLESVHQVWPDVAPYIEESIKMSNAEFTVEQARLYAANGMWQLVVFVEENGISGAALVEYLNKANARVAFVTALGGKLITTKTGFDGLKALVAANGATKFEGAVRESVARLMAQKFGMTEKYRIVEVDL